MGKPSVPAQPTPPSQQEIANATAETAEHRARRQRAMEFGEPLLKHISNDDGSSTVMKCNGKIKPKVKVKAKTKKV